MMTFYELATDIFDPVLAFWENQKTGGSSP